MSVGNNNVVDTSAIWSWSSKKSRQETTTKTKTSILVDILKRQTIPGNFAPTFVLLLQVSDLGYDRKSNYEMVKTLTSNSHKQLVLI